MKCRPSRSPAQSGIAARGSSAQLSQAVPRVDWYHNHRLNSQLDYVPPKEYEAAYYAHIQAGGVGPLVNNRRLHTQLTTSARGIRDRLLPSNPGVPAGDASTKKLAPRAEVWHAGRRRAAAATTDQFGPGLVDRPVNTLTFAVGDETKAIA
jgi:hypothetical protein